MRPRRCAAVVAAFGCSSSIVSAFTNTSPVVAWSNKQLDSLHLLAPQQSKSTSIFKQSAAHQLPLTTPEDDLCSLSTILLVSAPGLHYSDLKYLPSSSDSQTITIKSALQHSSTAQDHSNVVHPYVPFTKRGQLGSPERVVQKFVKDCGAVIETSNVKNFWSGQEDKVVRVEVVEGFEEWELTGQEARRERRQLIERLDMTVSEHLQSLYSSGQKFLVVLASVPTTSTDKLLTKMRSGATIVKRQFADEDEDTDSTNDIGVSDVESTWTEDVLDYVENAYEDVSDTLSSILVAPKDNQTSIFEPAPGSGLLHRYVFFSTPLIIALGLTLLVFIPLLLMTTQALGTTTTLKGLETKMTGQVAVDSSK
ncbi:hypothetical protein ACM66B_002762 [Microbotryomycetes sp. NB124-2]